MYNSKAISTTGYAYAISDTAYKNLCKSRLTLRYKFKTLFLSAYASSLLRLSKKLQLETVK
jgi:hypothetical protein